MSGDFAARLEAIRLLGLDPSRGALAAAKLRVEYLDKGLPVLSLPQMAPLSGLHETYISRATTILRKATPAQIAAIESGEATLNAVHIAMKGGRGVFAAADIKAEVSASYAVRAALWKRLRGALIALSELPSAKDVAALVRLQRDSDRVLEERLLPSLDFLKEFTDVWTSPQETTARRRRHGKGDSHPGNGDNPAGAQQTQPPAAGPTRPPDR